MMPIGGIPVVTRLLVTLEASGFQECVVVLAPDDKVTIPYLKEILLKEDENDASASNNKNIGNNNHNSEDQANPLAGKYQLTATKPYLVLESETTMKITILPLHDDCQGSIDALRKVEEASVVPDTSHMVLLPGDLVVFDTTVLCNLCDTHRQGYETGINGSDRSTACTVLLADVGEQDEHGVPLKESAKQKKGGVGRDEDDIEYIALTYPSAASSLSAPRMVWKQLKMDVHDTTAGLAETPKLSLPKPRIRTAGVTRVRTDWNDVHVYIFSPWVRRLAAERKSLITIQADLLPLLVSRQFEGVAATFGGQVEEAVVQEILKASPDLQTKDLAGPLEVVSQGGTGGDGNNLRSSGEKCKEYAVLAHIQDEAVRTHTIASYMHASREVVSQVSAIAADQSSNTKINSKSGNPCLQIPPKTLVRSNFHTILLPGSNIGDKVTLKSTTVGFNCKLGNKCRFNNVIVMDNVTIGDNVILQNSIVGAGCTIGDNCNLNDCQVASGMEISSDRKSVV